MRLSRVFFKNIPNWIGVFIVVFFTFVAIAAPVLSPQDPENPGLVKIVGSTREFEPQPPSPEAPLGTLSQGVSVYHSLVWGTRSAFAFGLIVVACISILGSLLGAIAAYCGGFPQKLLMQVTDAFLSFPMIAGIVLINQLFANILEGAGAWLAVGGFGGLLTSKAPTALIPEDVPLWLIKIQQFDPLIIAFILFSWMPYARIANTVVTRVMKMEYIEAARVNGVRTGRIILRHILPNAVSPLIVLAAKDIGGMVLLQATFAFVGMGGNSPWGMLLANGRGWIISPGGGVITYWWVFLPATLALILFGIGWNLLGDGLNDVLNVRSL
jgi:peptide/nickel transport system permease protein